MAAPVNMNLEPEMEPKVRRPARRQSGLLARGATVSAPDTDEDAGFETNPEENEAFDPLLVKTKSKPSSVSSASSSDSKRGKRKLVESEPDEAIKSVGFELLENEDLAERKDPYPWYWPIAGELRYLESWLDLFAVIRMTRWGRYTMHGFAGWLETLGLAPKGTKKTADSLAETADALVAGGEQKLFTPMYMMIARKPSQ